MKSIFFARSCRNCFFGDRDGLSCSNSRLYPVGGNLIDACWMPRGKSRNWRPFKKGKQTILG